MAPETVKKDLLILVQFSSDVMEVQRQPEASNEYFHTLHSLAFALSRYTRLKYKRKCKSNRKEMENFPFLASALVFAFAFALRLFTRVFTCVFICVCVARVNQP